MNTTPTLLMVHVDHLHRPVKMTNAAGASVWSAVWLPWGGAHTITGAEINDARFPGQWFQLEAGLHYNWHRAYDPSLGRYTQPDPLGFVDGPGVYAYARNAALANVDPEGLVIVGPQSKPPTPSGSEKCACPPGGRKSGMTPLGPDGPKIEDCFGRSGGRGNTTPYGGPSQRQIDRYKKQLDDQGPGSLEKSEKSLQKRLDEHQKKLDQYRSEGGNTSSVEREIRNFNNELSVIRSLLGK